MWSKSSQRTRLEERHCKIPSTWPSNLSQTNRSVFPRWPTFAMSTDERYLQNLVGQLISSTTDADITRLLAECSNSPLHPIFARERWYGISDLDLVRIAPALLLASNLLVSERASHFWHTILFGWTLMETDKHRVTRKRMHPAYSTQVPLHPWDKAKVLQILDEMSLAVKLHPANIEGELNGTYATCQGQAGVLSMQSVPFFAGSIFRGRPSTITISPICIEMLQPACMHGLPLLRRWLCLAICLVHEVAHAIWAAMHGNMEPLFADDTFCELGVAVTKWLFGGELIIFPLIHSHEEAMGITKIPNSHLVRAYRQHGLFPLLSPIPSDNNLVSKVDDTWVKKMFLTTTWTQVMPMVGSPSLRPPTTRCGCSKCGRSTKEEQPAMTSIDAGQPIRHRSICTTTCHCLNHPDTPEIGGRKEENIQWMLGLSLLQLLTMPAGELRDKFVDATRAHFRAVNFW